MRPLAALLFALASLLPAQPAAPRNVVVILADDLGSGDLTCYQPTAKTRTPHLDAIAAAGLRCTDVHSPSAVCTPTRYGLLTGRYAWRTHLQRGVLDGSSPALIEPGRETLASLLRRAGLATGCFGKWHLGLQAKGPTDYARPLRPGPLEVGFDTFFGIPASLDMPPYVFVADDAPQQPPTGKTPASRGRREGGAGFWRAGPIAAGFAHADVLETITARAAAWIEDRARAKERFFAYVPLTAPHTPWLPGGAWEGSSGAGPYGDFVHMVDAMVGRLDAVLRAAGVADDTLLVVTSDNGAHWTQADVRQYAHRANGPWRGQKADIHEGGHRVPFLVRWPGRVAAGATTAALGCLTDVFATCAGLFGLSLPDDAGEDSVDLGAVWLGAHAAAPRATLVHHSAQGMFAIRAGTWKYVAGSGSGGFTKVPTTPDDPPGQLYDLATDPAETTNLFAARGDVVARLEALLAAQRDAGRSVPRRGPPDGDLAERLVTRALGDNAAIGFLRDLLAKAPKRLGGSPGMADANAWALDAMRDVGLQGVRLEPVMVTRWDRGSVATLRVAGRAEHPGFAITALGGSIGTDPAGVSGKVIMVRSFEELRARADEAEGRIVFFNRPMPRVLRSTFRGYSDAVPQRGGGAVEAAKVGAVAAIVRSVTTALDDHPHTGAMRYEDGVAQVPAAAISTVGAEALAAMLAADADLTLRLTLDCAPREPVAGGNVVGELVGVTHPDEVVLFGAHLDAWDTGDGAHDDGAGCAHLLEMVRLLRAEGVHPGRTLRVVLFANEENGLDGARAYPRAHADELARHVAAVETDNGGFDPRGFGTTLDEARRERLAALLAPLRPLGMGALIEGGGGADIGPLRAHGVPLFGLVVADHRYFDFHHSARDTIDAVNERELALGGAALAFLASVLTDPTAWPR